MTGDRGLLVVVSGPSGVGKGTVIRRLLPRLPDARLSVSVTTRPPRDGERDGEHYHFVDAPRFDELVRGGALLEWAEYAGNRYGTPREEVERLRDAGRDVLLEIEVQGALQVRERVPDALLVFIAPPSFDELTRRLTGRGTEQDPDREVRLATARRELEARAHFDEVVVNDDVDRCAAEVAAIVARQRP